MVRNGLALASTLVALSGCADDHPWKENWIGYCSKIDTSASHVDQRIDESIRHLDELSEDIRAAGAGDVLPSGSTVSSCYRIGSELGRARQWTEAMELRALVVRRGQPEEHDWDASKMPEGLRLLAADDVCLGYNVRTAKAKAEKLDEIAAAVAALEDAKATYSAQRKAAIAECNRIGLFEF